MTRWPLLMVLLAMPALAAAEDAVPAAGEARPIVSEIVDAQDGLPISYVGKIAAKIEVDLGFPMIGTIAERPVEQGDVVAKGDVLARLDPEDLDASVRAAEASVAVAEAQANTARDARDRARELVARGVGAQARLDDGERALIAADARLEQARASLERAKDMLALATLRAPQDGIVTMVNEEPGATLSAGQPVLQLSGTNEREVVIDLSEEDTAALVPEAEFVISLVANPDVTARARLDRIDPVAEKNTRTRRVHLRLDDPPAAFRLGALVHVAPGTASGAAIVLPMSAILDADEAASVWVVDRGTNTVHRVPVGLGARFGDFTIVASGLSTGDEVVTRGIHSLQEGQTVGPRLSE